MLARIGVLVVMILVMGTGCTPEKNISPTIPDDHPGNPSADAGEFAEPWQGLDSPTPATGPAVAPQTPMHDMTSMPGMSGGNR